MVDSSANKFQISPLVKILIRSLRNHPSIRNEISPLLKKVPICLNYKSKVLTKIYIDWEKNDEIAEVFEQIESSALLFLNTSLRPDLVMDIGASCGISTQILASQSPHAEIFAYEPRPDAFCRLKKRASQIQGNKHFHNTAVGLQKQVVAFNESGLGTKRSNKKSDSFAANVVPIDEKIISSAKHGLLLKIDIEGDEKLLLPSLMPVLPKKSVVLLETHHPLKEVETYALDSFKLGYRWHMIRYRELPSYGGPFADWLITGPSVIFT